MGENKEEGDKKKKEKISFIRYIETRWVKTIIINILINFFFGFAGKYIHFFFTEFPDPTPAFGAISISTDFMWMSLYLGLFLAWFETQETYEDAVTRKLVEIPELERKKITSRPQRINQC